MKKIVAIISILAVCAFANAQFFVTSPNAYLQINTLSNIDAVFLFNGISSSTEISYSGSGNKEWREYNGTYITSSNTTEILLSPEDGTGYILYIDGVPSYWIWTIDYSLYAAALNNLQVAQVQQNICENLILAANITAPELVYYDKNNQRNTLTRSFSLDYVDYAFVGDNWQDQEVTRDINFPFTQITVPAPKKNVTFVLSGDNFAQQMNIQSSISLDYNAVAVESHLKGTINKRDVVRPPDNKPNEMQREKPDSTITGSAPLIVDLMSRANTPVAAYFSWKIYTVDVPSNYLQYFDENLYKHDFPETKTYSVKLKVSSNGGCTCEDSIQVIGIKSVLWAPSFFSPNGDTLNDEFLVAYSSIDPKSYKCVIFNRWGNVVFSSTDPNKGWDGNIHGKPAAVGTYYYVITAIGTDVYDKNQKNAGKPKKYSFYGAVNLFR